MDTQDFNQILSITREIVERINYTETQLTPFEITEHFVGRDIENTGEIFQSLFLLATELKLIMELYDNSESGFFLSLTDSKKEELFLSLVLNANSHVYLYERLKKIAPDKLTSENFLGMDENLLVIARTKEFLISKNLYTG